MPLVEFGVGDDLSSTISVGRENRKWCWARAIKKAIQVLAFEVGYNLCLPKEVVVPGKFDGNQVMNLSERVGVVLEEAGEVVSVFMDEEEAIAAKVFDKRLERKKKAIWTFVTLVL
jgi:cob(I)alamin adenosyltransferase